MSWFSDLTSKAEAMLVRLDQDAAQALQKPETILTRTRLLDKDASVLDTNRETEPILDLGNQEDDVIVTDTEEDQLSSGVSATRTNPQSHEHSCTSVVAPTVEIAPQPLNNSNGTTPDAATNMQHVRKHPGHITADQDQNIHTIKESPTPLATINHQTPQQARKFKLQTSKLRQPLLDRQASSKANTAPELDNGYKVRTREIRTPYTSLGADDIRASINRSLQEYSLTTSPFSHQGSREPTTFTSHFDDQPNLVRSVDREGNNSRLNDRLQSSPSFSINFPDNGGSSTDIADQILRQSAMKRKSSFNLHKVLNKLAGNSGQSQAIIGDKTKIKLRRAQIRIASYMRRLNHYFRAYPTMKYWAIGYLVLLQLLVVYVLFFYKSTGSSNYLAVQVRQQQEELSGSLQSSGGKIISPGL